MVIVVVVIVVVVIVVVVIREITIITIITVSNEQKKSLPMAMAVAEHRPVVAEHVAEPENLEKKTTKRLE